MRQCYSTFSWPLKSFQPRSKRLPSFWLPSYMFMDPPHPVEKLIITPDRLKISQVCTKFTETPFWKELVITWWRNWWRWQYCGNKTQFLQPVWNWILTSSIFWQKMKISKNFNLASSLGCILHVNFQIIKISISWYLQVVLTLKLNQRYLIKQFIECHNFELVI